MPFLLTLFLLLSAAADAQEPPPGMSTYQVVFLRRGPAAASPEIMEAHLAHLEKLEREGTLVGAGPIASRESDIRGLLILKGVSRERARELAADDPAAKAGGLVPEVLPWWGPDNIGDAYFTAMKANPSAQPKMITYQLGLLRAGPNRSQPKDEAERIQAAHLAHIESLSKSGKLVAAGPFLIDAELRGIFLFDVPAEDARALTAGDPAVQAGRLVLDLRPWMVAEGVFTRRAVP